MQSTNGSDRDLALMASARREAEGLAQADRLGVPEAGDPEERAQAEAPDGYRLVRGLRRGAQGDVCEGVQEATGRRVAIKFLGDRAKSGAERARLEREARLLARMNHPNLVQVLDCGETPTGRFFAVIAAGSCTVASGSSPGIEPWRAPTRSGRGLDGPRAS